MAGACRPSHFPSAASVRSLRSGLVRPDAGRQRAGKNAGGFFFNGPPPTEIYTLSLHDALPICRAPRHLPAARRSGALAAKCGEHLAGLREAAGLGLREHEPPVGAHVELSLRAGSGLGVESLGRSEEHTSELQSLTNLVCRLLLE